MAMSPRQSLRSAYEAGEQKRNKPRPTLINDADYNSDQERGK